MSRDESERRPSEPDAAAELDAKEASVEVAGAPAGDAPLDRWARVRAALPRLQKGATWTLAAALALAFGVSFGFDYGVDNQVVYLLGSLDLVKPELFESDWLVQQTTHYHPVYQYLCAALLELSPSGWPIAVGLTLVASAGGLCLYWMLGQLLQRGAFVSYVLLITLLRVTGTRGPAASYIFDHILQPSTLGACGTVFAIAFFIRGRHLASGIAVAIAGLCHANYLLLDGLAFGLAQLFLGTRGIVRRAIRQLALPTVALLMLSPLIIKTAMSPHAEQARDIYFNVRAPHHFSPEVFQNQFPRFVAWHLLGVGFALPLMRKAKAEIRRFAAITAGLLTVVWLGTLFTTAFKVAPVANLFPWRLAPFVLLMLQIAVCAGAVSIAMEPGFRKRLTPTQLGLTVSGIGFFGMTWGMGKVNPVWNITLALVGLAVVGFLVGLAYDLAQQSGRAERLLRRLDLARLRRAVSVLVLVGSGVVWAVVFPKELAAVKDRSNLIRGFDPQLAELYAWMHEHTNVDAVFLTPPEIETMRYRGERAIIVDWKSNPVVPAELLEWHQRLADVTGRPHFRSSRDLAGYDSLDQGRLDALERKYRIDYVIVRRGLERRLPGLPIVYRNGGYTVLGARGGAG